MIVRLAVAATVAAGLALSTPGAQAAPAKVLDGKKTKVLTFTAVGAPQTNDADLITGSIEGGDRTNCQMPRCAYLDFIYQPAKGVRPVGLYFEAAWSAPVADIDLYVAAVDRYGDPAQLEGGSCGMFTGTKERIYLSKANFKPGKRYRVVVDFYRTVNERVTAKVVFNGKDTRPSTVPSDVEKTTLLKINCGL